MTCHFKTYRPITPALADEIAARGGVLETVAPRFYTLTESTADLRRYLYEHEEVQHLSIPREEAQAPL